MAIDFWLQGSNPLSNDLYMVEVYYQMGIRGILLCYNGKNAVGDGCIERTDCGLSNFGVRLIEEMNRVGMLVDCSHAGYKTSMDAKQTSTQPVIYSHSNAHAIHPHPRNLKDDQLKACAKTGGIVGLNGMSIMLGDESCSKEKYVEHIAYVADFVGSEHVALGLDLVYFHEIMDLFYQQAGPYPKGYLPQNPSALNSYQPEGLVDIVELLLQRGFKEDEIKGILGENFLRVAKQVWK